MATVQRVGRRVRPSIDSILLLSSQHGASKQPFIEQICAQHTANDYAGVITSIEDMKAKGMVLGERTFPRYLTALCRTKQVDQAIEALIAKGKFTLIRRRELNRTCHTIVIHALAK